MEGRGNVEVAEDEQIMTGNDAHLAEDAQNMTSNANSSTMQADEQSGAQIMTGGICAITSDSNQTGAQITGSAADSVQLAGEGGSTRFDPNQTPTNSPSPPDLGFVPNRNLRRLPSPTHSTTATATTITRNLTFSNGAV